MHRRRFLKSATAGGLSVGSYDAAKAYIPESLKAELEVKGMRYPVRWACRQKINSDGSLTLRHNYEPEQPLVETTEGCWRGGCGRIRALTQSSAFIRREV